MVTLLEYGQVIYGGDAEAEAIAPHNKEDAKAEESNQSLALSSDPTNSRGHL